MDHDLITSESFDILERIAKQHPELNLTGYFARATGGADINQIIKALDRTTNPGSLTPYKEQRLS